MTKITKELLKKRAEHNDGELESLEEITLHQYDIEKIEYLQECCRNLRILYLQSNQIQKLENLNKLKRLEYLNLALNNIQRIENLESLESLRKLDLTINFIEDILSVEQLRANEALRELYLTGNACTSQEGYRSFVIAALPQLQSLDGQAITKSERLLAAQEYERLRERFVMQSEALSLSAASEKSPTEQVIDPANFNLNEPVPHTPEARLQAARELSAKRAQGRTEEPPPRPKPVETPPVSFHDDGRIRQRNMPKLNFRLIEESNRLILNVKISPFVDTSLLELQVERTWVRVVVKGRALDVALPMPIDKDKSSAVRGQLTGELEIKMPREGAQEGRTMLSSFTGYVAGDTKSSSNVKPLAKVDYRNIISHQHPEKENISLKLLSVKQPSSDALKRQKQALEEFEENEDVPPLE